MGDQVQDAARDRSRSQLHPAQVKSTASGGRASVTGAIRAVLESPNRHLHFQRLCGIGSHYHFHRIFHQEAAAKIASFMAGHRHYGLL